MLNTYQIFIGHLYFILWKHSMKTTDPFVEWISWSLIYLFFSFIYSECFSLFDAQLAKMLRKVFQKDRYHMFTYLLSYAESAFEKRVWWKRGTYFKGKKRGNTHDMPGKIEYLEDYRDQSYSGDMKRRQIQKIILTFYLLWNFKMKNITWHAGFTF